MNQAKRRSSYEQNRDSINERRTERDFYLSKRRKPKSDSPRTEEERRSEVSKRVCEGDAKWLIKPLLVPTVVLGFLLGPRIFRSNGWC